MFGKSFRAEHCLDFKFLILHTSYNPHKIGGSAAKDALIYFQIPLKWKKLPTTTIEKVTFELQLLNNKPPITSFHSLPARQVQFANSGHDNCLSTWLSCCLLYIMPFRYGFHRVPFCGQCKTSCMVFQNLSLHIGWKGFQV